MVANVLGGVAESYGMNNLDALDTEFVPPAEAAWEQVPVLLAEFLMKNPPKSDYVLYAQYLGDPNIGPKPAPAGRRAWVLFWQVCPWCAGAKYLEYSFEDVSIVSPGSAAASGLFGFWE